jgi:hypothetical protein
LIACRDFFYLQRALIPLVRFHIALSFSRLCAFILLALSLTLVRSHIALSLSFSRLCTFILLSLTLVRFYIALSFSFSCLCALILLSLSRLCALILLSLTLVRSHIALSFSLSRTHRYIFNTHFLSFLFICLFRKIFAYSCYERCVQQIQWQQHWHLLWPPNLGSLLI